MAVQEIGVYHLHDKLDKCGLDVEHWSNVLKSTLGITKLQQAQYLSEKDIPCLSMHSRWSWEISALRRFVNSQNEAEGGHVTPDVVYNATEMMKKTLRIIDELKVLNATFGDRDENMIESKVNELYLMLNAPEIRLRQMDKDTISHVIRSLSADLSKLGDQVETIRDIPCCELLENASDGLTLRGVLKVDDAHETVARRAVALSVPTNLKIEQSRSDPQTFILEHTSEDDWEEYLNTLQNLGSSIASGSPLGKTERKNNKDGRCHDEYYSRTACVNVPTAVVNLKNAGPLILSEELLRELHDIATLLTSGVDEHMLKSKCKELLLKFGSHVNVGEVHLGGMYIFAVTHHGSVLEGVSLTDMVGDILTDFISIGRSGLLPAIQVTGSLSAEWLQKHGLITAKYPPSALTKIGLQVRKIGGLEAIDSVPLWKQSLEMSMDRWNVIDRGSSFSTDFCCIWDLMKQCPIDNVTKLAELLQREWHELGGRPTPQSETELLASRDLKRLEHEMAKWGDDPNLSQNAVDYVEQIQMTVQMIESNSQWQTILENNASVAHFFHNITKIDFPAQSSHHLKSMLSELLIDRAAGVFFEGIDTLKEWVNVVDEGSIVKLGPDGKEGLEPPNIQQDRVQDKVPEHWDQTSVPRRLDTPEDEIYVQEETLEHLVEKDVPDHDRTDSPEGGDQTSVPRRLDPPEDEIYVQGETPEHLAEKDVPDHDLTDSPEGEISVPAKTPEHLVEKGVPGQSDPLAQEGGKPAPELPEHLVEKGTSGKELLKELHLDSLYPCKITMQMVIKGMGSSEKEKDKLSLEETPWFMLKKLLMIDYRGRNISWERKLDTSARSSGDVPHVDGSFESFFAGIGDAESKCSNIPNPIDIFLATFSCCDLMLRQVLLEKMTVCRLAVPFILPDLYADELTLCRWALRAIVLDRPVGEQMIESSFVECPVKIASIVRIGKTQVSKSQLLNDVINEQSHHTFFSKEACSVPIADKTVSNGLVEAAWYIPRNKKDDLFQDVTVFLNLRGACEDHPKQTKWMSSVSSVVTVVVDVNLLSDDSTVATLKRLRKRQADIILVIAGSADEHRIKTVLTQYRSKIGEHITAIQMMNAVQMPGRHKTMNEITHDLRRLISDIIKEKPTTTFENVTCNAKQEKIAVDEDDEACQEGKRFADIVIHNMGNMSLDKLKAELLPLQKSMWPEWSQLNKDQHRTTGRDGKTTSYQESAMLTEKMLSIRAKQIDQYIKQYSPFIKSFSNGLSDLIGTPAKAQYYLQWLKLHFDKLSREQIPGLRQEYKEMWTQLNASKSKKGRNTDDLEELKQKVQKAEADLAEASCGLEHLFREIGQIYEASEEVERGGDQLDSKTLREIKKLPEIAANLLLLGHPIEFMDGDAASVPLTWVKAILEHLGHVTKHKKVLVLSVLGIQSSGKSTLMNTMFGMRFAVSAGRCTRGVFVQLVEVDRSETGLPFDYILVVDTEGLRAPELCHDKHEHDNELATLAIGFGDIVILNIKGENVTEMEDVLQITVQAFLRMKKVKLNQTCVFIHQNVAAANANEKMMQGRQTFLDKLDAMAVDAAAEEHIPNITAFSQIIELNVENCVWYFSDLWRGDPPMAPANPGYSESVGAVKDCLLYKIARAKKDSILSVPNLCTRFEDLWKGILADDFVFSFRNTLAVKAYSGLERKYQDEAWAMEKSVSGEWMQNAWILIERCATEDGVEKTSTVQLTELSVMVADLVETHTEELKQYFDHDPLKETTVQWREEKLTSLSYFAQTLANGARREIEKKREELLFEFRNMTRQEDLEKIVMSKASELAKLMKDEDSTQDELQDTFDEMWTKWVAEIAPPPLRQEGSIAADVEHTLYSDKFLAKDCAALRRELSVYPLSSQLEGGLLENGSFFRVEDEDIEVERAWGLAWTGEFLGPPKPNRKVRKKAKRLTKVLFERIETTLKGISSSNRSYNKSYASEVVNEVFHFVQHHNSQSEDKFKLTSHYRVRVTVHICRRAVQVFEDMRSSYNRKHSPAAKLHDMKISTFNLFKNKVRDCSNEQTAADLFCDNLARMIKKYVNEKLPSLIFETVYNSYSKQKYHLIIAVLEDLAQKNDFSLWSKYLMDAKTYSTKWIEAKINEVCFGSERTYFCIARANLKEVVTRVVQCIDAASGHGHSNEWIRTFCDEAATHLAVREGQLSSDPMQGINLESFKKLVLGRLREVHDEILQSFSEVNSDTVEWAGVPPYQTAMDKLWGCGAQCPFCQEPCQWTDSEHGTGSNSHRCIQHRPQGVGGYRWFSEERNFDKNYLLVESCSFHVNSSIYFWLNLPSGRECHPYKRYKEVYPDWDIAPSPTMESSTFWMWFMTKYEKELAKHHDAKPPLIPDSWKRITKEEALKSLREIK